MDVDMEAVWPLRLPEGPGTHDQPRPPGAQRSAWERRVPPGSRPARGREEATQYHQLRILCALRDKIAENERGCPLWARVPRRCPSTWSCTHQSWWATHRTNW